MKLTKNKHKLLIDGDLLVYKAAFAHENKLELPDSAELISTFSAAPARRLVNMTIKGLCTKFNTNRYCIYLSGNTNFRKDLDPTYKANRIGVVKPVGLKDMIEYIKSAHPHVVSDGIEADDQLAMDAVADPLAILVSADKDLLGVPAWVYHSHLKTPRLYHADVDQAYSFALFQAIHGDAVDGYKGLPNHGLVRTTEFMKRHAGTKFVHLFELMKEDLWNELRHQRHLAQMLWYATWNPMEPPTEDFIIQFYLPYFLPKHTAEFGQVVVSGEVT